MATIVERYCFSAHTFFSVRLLSLYIIKTSRRRRRRVQESRCMAGCRPSGAGSGAGRLGRLGSATSNRLYLAFIIW